jgi:FkbM family methyltransferase
MAVKELIKRQFVFIAILYNYKKYGYLFYSFRDFYLFFKEYYRSKTKKESIKSVRLKNADKLPIYYRPGSTDQGVLLAAFHHKYQDFEFKFTEQPIIFDLGANAGYCSRYFLIKYPGSFLVSVELDIKNFVLLKRNTEHFTNCKCFHAGIWYKDGKVSYSGLNEDAFRIEENETPFSNIDSIRMESLINKVEIDWIDYIKMDIEGAEQKIFSNDLTWLNKVGCINLEYHDENLDFYKTKLEEKGFRVIKNEKHWAGLIAFKERRN